tara:strand:- start:647 stop:886 length:240 start_codon:yes stop_codon:yes gene_type:complete
LKKLCKIFKRCKNKIKTMKISPKIDALQLMLTDLRTRNEPIRHKAAFKGCQPEFQSLVSRLIKQLEDELNDEKNINRYI